jgi:hypothetical protein
VPAPAERPYVAAPITPAALDLGSEDDLAAEAPSVLTVFHHGKQVATVRPFDRRNTRANGRRPAAPAAQAPTDRDDFDDEELPEKFLLTGDGD